MSDPDTAPRPDLAAEADRELRAYPHLPAGRPVDLWLRSLPAPSRRRLSDALATIELSAGWALRDTDPRPRGTARPRPRRSLPIASRRCPWI